MGEPATPASDRYALAVVAFELLTGEPAVRGRALRRPGARAHRGRPAAPRAELDPSHVPARRRRDRPRHGQGPRRPLGARRCVEALDDALAPPPRPRTPRPRDAAATHPDARRTPPPPRAAGPGPSTVARPPRRRAPAPGRARRAAARAAAAAADRVVGAPAAAARRRRRWRPRPPRRPPRTARPTPTPTAEQQSTPGPPTPPPARSSTPTPTATAEPASGDPTQPNPGLEPQQRRPATRRRSRPRRGRRSVQGSTGRRPVRLRAVRARRAPAHRRPGRRDRDPRAAPQRFPDNAAKDVRSASAKQHAGRRLRQTRRRAFDAVARAVAGVPFMSPARGRIVYDHVRERSPAEVLELGTAHGVGAAYLAGALADNARGHLTTVDFAGAAYDPRPRRCSRPGSRARDGGARVLLLHVVAQGAGAGALRPRTATSSRSTTSSTSTARRTGRSTASRSCWSRSCCGPAAGC